MNRKLILPLLLAAVPLVAQQPAVADKPVAVVNGETINAQRLDAQWSAIGTKARDQYKENGGKPAFLSNYLINRRLIVQEAIKSGFDKQPDVQAEVEAAKEKALFDRYVRDVVSASIVTESLIHKYYDEHPQDFAVPEKIKVRHIVLVANPAMPNGLTKEQALEQMKQVAVDLHNANASIKAADPA